MAKSKAKEKLVVTAKTDSVKDKAAEVVPVEITPLATIVTTEVAQVSQPTITPTSIRPTVTENKKSGGGCWKWFACCLILLVICCSCVIGSSYLALFQAGTVIKWFANSQPDTTLTKIKPQDAIAFNSDQYFQVNPATDLNNGTFEMTIPEAVLLKLMLNDPSNAYMADYIGVKAQNDVLKMQIDVGSIAKYQIDQNGGYNVFGINVNTSNLEGIYANVEVTTNGTTPALKSIKLGDSGIDLSPLFKNTIDQFLNSNDPQSAFASVQSIHFENGNIVIVYKGDTSEVPNIVQNFNIQPSGY
jgi:hypothetical protein